MFKIILHLINQFGENSKRKPQMLLLQKKRIKLQTQKYNAKIRKQQNKNWATDAKNHLKH